MSVKLEEISRRPSYRLLDNILTLVTVALRQSVAPLGLRHPVSNNGIYLESNDHMDH